MRRYGISGIGFPILCPRFSKMFFQFSNLNKFLVGALIGIAVFFGLPVFAEEEISQEIITETEISNENEAAVENNVETVAETGNNSASGGDGGSNGEASGATITTGDSLASANVINVVNTNIFNSAGFFFILSVLFGQIGTIDLREAMMTNTSSSTPSLTSLCASNLFNP